MRRSLLSALLTILTAMFAAASNAGSLNAKIGYTKIVLDPDKPLAHAQGSIVPVTLTYAPQLTNVQSGAISYPLSTGAQAISQTISISADIRTLLKHDEEQIRQRCRSTLDHNKVKRSIRSTPCMTRSFPSMPCRRAPRWHLSASRTSSA